MQLLILRKVCRQLISIRCVEIRSELSCNCVAPYECVCIVARSVCVGSIDGNAVDNRFVACVGGVNGQLSGMVCNHGGVKHQTIVADFNDFWRTVAIY